jgi:hypothetical protein
MCWCPCAESGKRTETQRLSPALPVTHAGHRPAPDIPGAHGVDRRATSREFHVEGVTGRVASAATVASKAKPPGAGVCSSEYLIAVITKDDFT